MMRIAMSSVHRIRNALLLGALVTLAAPALGQPVAPPDLPRPLPRPEGAGAPREAPSEEAKGRQLERVKRQAAERRAKRAERARDRKKALRKSMNKWLKGGPITPEVREELRTHAHRVARLLRVQELAANRGDYDTVKRVERLVTRENSRHERFLRDFGRPPRPATPPPPPGTVQPKTPNEKLP
jgi:hypothetical protein